MQTISISLLKNNHGQMPVCLPTWFDAQANIRSIEYGNGRGPEKGASIA
jgi:hypothetical protein